MESRFDDRFFASTRGRIVLLLRESAKTVNDLAALLGITDNAVRAHLLSLERDQLVRPGGSVPGSRKPHVIYELTDSAREHFPRPYGSILKRFLGVLKERLSGDDIASDLSETGRRMADDVAIILVLPCGVRHQACDHAARRVMGARLARRVPATGSEDRLTPACVDTASVPTRVHAGWAPPRSSL